MILSEDFHFSYTNDRKQTSLYSIFKLYRRYHKKNMSEEKPAKTENSFDLFSSKHLKALQRLSQEDSNQGNK